MVRVGQPMKLECQLVGNPKPELTWKLDGKPLAAANAKVSIEQLLLYIRPLGSRTEATILKLDANENVIAVRLMCHFGAKLRRQQIECAAMDCVSVIQARIS